MTLAKRPDDQTIEKAVLGGDLDSLTPSQRVAFYGHICESLGLNPLTKPFLYIKLNGKLTLYASRDCTDQLRNIHQISTQITAREMVSDIYVVTARASKGDRVDESIGAVSVQGLKGEFLANAMMKAETKAKRRVTLSINGLGIIDESEVQSIERAEEVNVDSETGEIIDGRRKAINAPAKARPAPTAPQPEYGEDVWSLSVAEMGNRLTNARVSLGIPQEELKAQATLLGLDNPANMKHDQFIALMDWMIAHQHMASNVPDQEQPDMAPTFPESEEPVNLPDVVDEAPETDVSIPDMVDDPAPEDIMMPLEDLLKDIEDDYTWDQTLDLGSQLGILTRSKFEGDILHMSVAEWEKLDGTAATAARRLVRTRIQERDQPSTD